jgi:hypothetical protein
VSFSTVPSPRVFNFILSFPLLEDLTLFGIYGVSADDDRSDGLSTAVQPSSPPVFTGSLGLRVGVGGMKPFTRLLLSSPGGIHFRELTLTCFLEEHLSQVVALIEGCSHTLESLDISDLRGTSVQHLRLQPWLTFVCRRPWPTFYRPFECDKTQGCGVSAQLTELRMGHHGTPNHHIQPPRTSTNLDPGGWLLGVRPHQY